MKIYDISQELLGCEVYPGDPAPLREVLCTLDQGGVCNLSTLFMCAHNGTHVDAPYHFVNMGKTVEQLSLTKLVGWAYVAEHDGILLPQDVWDLLKRARQANAESAKRILFKGNVQITPQSAQELIECGVELLGVEAQSVSPAETTAAIHTALLSAETVLLEGIRLSEVAEGVYLLSAAPLSVKGGDGAPCRAVLISM